jgi:hypothetical protein
MESSIAQRLAFGDRALRTVIEAMPRIAFDESKHQELYAATLHASIVQLCGGCLALARAEHTIGIPTLLRSMFEALVDLDNLIHNADYHERMDAANLSQFLKVLRDCPELAHVRERPDYVAASQEWQSQLDDLIARKRRGKHIKTRCIDVGREGEYRGIYSLLCMDAHNNVAALVERHVSEGESKRLRVDLFGDGNPLGLANRIFTAVGWMLVSAEYAHGAFRTGFSVVELQRECETFRVVTDI